MPTENRSSNTEMVSVPREHELKIRQTPLADLLSGLKTGEIRDCSDRDFAVGDTVLLREIDDSRDYTGMVLRRTITHVQKNYGLPDHLCVLSYGQPTQQPLPEPIAWMVGTAFWWTKEEAERDAAETGKTITPIGPMSGIAPAEEHQGEPVALPAMKNANSGHDTEDSYGDGWDDCLREIAKLGPLYKRPVQGEPVAWQVNWPNGTRELYTHEVGAKASMMPYQPLYLHADPGEVERLTEQLEVANQTIAYAARQAEEKQKVTDALMADAKQFRGERDTLRAQLAERDALLRELADAPPAAMEFRLQQKVKAALSASAEPGAPGVLPRAHDVNMFQRTAQPGAKS
ncbi:DUF3850 domain-containing protein [Pseudomonas asiatica]|uniref:DUF3850 domain-containing protein n=1 Tax=Pseudomonas asiatica TaxID=2219225 RepID=UPI001BAE789B|nr:DUF3850 domain-containing protein [Pseudomonas asiatica]